MGFPSSPQRVPKVFPNALPKMFPIAPQFYPLWFAQSSTPMYINFKGATKGKHDKAPFFELDGHSQLVNVEQNTIFYHPYIDPTIHALAINLGQNM
jgi:hypothetical protein